jgi:hypothetical protein
VPVVVKLYERVPAPSKRLFGQKKRPALPKRQSGTPGLAGWESILAVTEIGHLTDCAAIDSLVGRLINTALK